MRRRGERHRRELHAKPGPHAGLEPGEPALSPSTTPPTLTVTLGSPEAGVLNQQLSSASKWQTGPITVNLGLVSRKLAGGGVDVYLDNVFIDAH